ncbi:MAG: nickel pincer cofactor biosynthesis protein LarB [Methanobrevibacter sp.]|jgi:NCAIR mutase (PurE)-related protein|nr:nickel pincer cofactor biosynthesis protein LarB [Methanobrevibacter sp.]
MKKILKELLEEKITIEEAEILLKTNSILELDEIANFDKNRENRTGFPEAILAQGKEYEDLIAIIKGYFNEEESERENSKEKSVLEKSVLITRLTKKLYLKLEKDLEYLKNEGFKLNYNHKARILKISGPKAIAISPKYGKIGIITAGTSDIAIGEEARVIVEEGGCEVLTSYDVGVAGIHRLFPQIAKMIEEKVQAIIVCAGMEGALPSVVAGLVDVPVIGVPTSVGYGVGGKGKAALYAMLQSCAPGIAVVNIDNGFGAGVFALTLAKNNK